MSDIICMIFSLRLLFFSVESLVEETFRKASGLNFDLFLVYIYILLFEFSRMGKGNVQYNTQHKVAQEGKLHCSEWYIIIFV